MNSHRQSIRTTLEEVLIDGREATLEFTRVTVVSHDTNADCDADGNRGVPRDEIDEDYAEDITVQFDDPATGRLTVAVVLDSLPEGTRALVTAALDVYIETHDPEYEDDEPNPDEARDRWMDRDEDDWRRER